MIHDFIVVGSGMTGAHASQSLLDGGARVLMLDGGVRDEQYGGRLPDRDFVTLRETDEDQHAYFLGRDFEGIPWGPAAHTLTPPRHYLLAETDRWLRVHSDEFMSMESLAYGGLGAGWGAGCAVYTPKELEAIGLDPEPIRAAYAIVADRIGLAAQIDDATPHCGAGVAPALPPLRMDRSIATLHDAYRKHRDALNRAGVVMGKMPMAVLTTDRGERGANAYHDMEYWTDHDRSVYRTWMTLDALEARDDFEYMPDRLLVRFEERDDHVVLTTRRLRGSGEEIFRARRLVLGTGTLGTARVVLRGLPDGSRLPLLSNPYEIALGLHYRMLGRAVERLKTSMGQLEMFLEPGSGGLDGRMASLFTYRSLLLFKLVKEVPMSMADALPLMRMLLPGIVLAGINHPDRPTADKYVERVPDPDSSTGDALHIVHRLSEPERRENRSCTRRFTRALGRLGCPILRVQDMPPGAAVHYAGCLPYVSGGEPGTLDPAGRLNGTRRVFVADGSGFRHLPANGLTFTLMANAHRVALNALKAD